MKKISSFNRNTVKSLNEEIENALSKIASKYDLNIKLGNCSFNPNNFTLGLTASVKDASGLSMTREAELFKAYASLVGLNAEDLGKTFQYKNQTLRIAGLKRGAKFNILLEDVNGGRGMRMNSDYVKSLIKSEVAIIKGSLIETTAPTFN